jgi:hypothetical protein
MHGFTFLPAEYVVYTYTVPPSQQDPAILAELLIPKYDDLVTYWAFGDRKVGPMQSVERIANEAARHTVTLVRLYRASGVLPTYALPSAGGTRTS